MYYVVIFMLLFQSNSLLSANSSSEMCYIFSFSFQTSSDIPYSAFAF